VNAGPESDRQGRPTSVDVSVVVVTYNNEAVIERCLRAVEDSVTGHSYELLVVDNASDDRTVALVEETAPSAVVSKQPRNLGFAAANNLALEYARGRFVVLVNSDAFIDPGAVDLMVDLAETSPSIGIVGARLRDAAGRFQPSAGRFPSLPGNLAVAVLAHRIPPFSHLESTVFADASLYSRARRVDWVSGAFCLARPEIGPLPSDGFMYGEDVEWARIARARGFESWIEPGAGAIHLGAGGDETLESARRRQAYRVQFERRWFGQRGWASAFGSRLVMTIHAVVRLALFAGLWPLRPHAARLRLGEFTSLLRETWRGGEARKVPG
jgi:GT2 family glycosyltransferase